MLLPGDLSYVFLSALVPNASDFAEWICWTHQQPCHVVCTDRRHMLQQHFVTTAIGAEYTKYFYESLDILVGDLVIVLRKVYSRSSFGAIQAEWHRE